MAKLLQFPGGSSFDPTLIAGVVKFPGKGVVLRNEYNKIILFEQEPDAARQTVIARVVNEIVESGRNWIQPDWDAEFATIAKPTPDTKSGNNTPNKGV